MSTRMRLSLLLILFTVRLCPSTAQTTGTVLSDLEGFLDHVRMHHPVALAAELRPMAGDAAVRQARGAFDPRLGGSVDQKQFDDKQYYNHGLAGLRIPTWVGVDFYAAYEQNRGVYLNPENLTPDGGLALAGVSLPLGRGLLTDERRTALKKAKIIENVTLEERKMMLNDLMAEAGSVYLDWQLATEVEKVQRKALDFATERLEAVKLAALLGDRPAIDTLEAGIQVMDRQNNLLQAEMNLRNATAALAAYLWQDGLIPLEPDPAAMTQIGFPRAIMPEERKLTQVDSLLALHPEIRVAALKPEMLKLDERLRAENLKPTVNLKYNFLNEPVGDNPLAGLSAENYSRGLQVSFPLFLRHERGALQLARVAVKEAEFELADKAARLKMKAAVALNEWAVSYERSGIADKMAKDFEALSNAEKELFAGGESSLFMVNARETAYIGADIKRLETIIKNRQAQLKAQQALGLLAP